MILKEMYVYSYRDEKELKHYSFRANGLNIILGEKSLENDDETNGVGKTTMIECIEFLLGKGMSKDYVLNTDIIEASVFIAMEVEVNGGSLFLGRHFNTPKKGYVLKGQTLTFDLSEWKSHNNAEYRKFIEGIVMQDEKTDLSFASLREYIIRNEKTGFNDIVLMGREATKNYALLAYLFGLPFQFETEVNQLKKEIDAYKQQIKLIESIGTQIDKLKMQEDELNKEITEIKSTIDSFDVSERFQKNSAKYSDIKNRLNMVQKDIFELEHVIEQYQKNIENLSEKTKGIKELKDIVPFFEQLVGYFPNRVKKNYEEIEQFYDFMVDNRGKYFKGKISSLESELKQLRENKRVLETELRDTSRILRNNKFIEDMTSIMKELEDKQLRLAEIKVRISEYNKRNSINDKINELETEKLRLTTMRNDEFNTYSEHVQYVESIFNKQMIETYNQIGVLNFEYENSSKSNMPTGRIKIRCSIPDEKSHGRQYMKINMFDLTWLLYRIEKNYPINFLIHDGSYSKPDVSVKPRLLNYVNSILQSFSRGQYFITINIDELLEEDIDAFDKQKCIVAKLDRSKDENRFLGFKF